MERPEGQLRPAMHELSLCQSLVQIAVEQAQARGASRIHRVDLALGALAGVQADALSFCFPLVAKDTLCEGAELSISSIPAQGRCDACGTTSIISDLMTPCPNCQGWPLKVEGGSGLSLRSLEVS